jgi:hypothetical protein
MRHFAGPLPTQRTGFVACEVTCPLARSGAVATQEGNKNYSGHRMVLDGPENYSELEQY